MKGLNNKTMHLRFRCAAPRVQFRFGLASPLGIATDRKPARWHACVVGDTAFVDHARMPSRRPAIPLAMGGPGLHLPISATAVAFANEKASTPRGF